MKVYTKSIGPEEARELLSFNVRNRNLRTVHVAKLAADMRNGAWRDGGSILFAGDGLDRVLIDGQHRLQAIIESDTKVTFVVIEGLGLEDQQAVDTGMRRSLADVLKWKGEQNCIDLAAAIAWLWRWNTGNVRSNWAPTTAQSLDTLQQNPGLRDAITPTRLPARTLRLARGMCACLYYKQLDLDVEDTIAFWDMLTTGLVPDGNERHPVHVLRRQLEDNARKTGRRLDPVGVAALIIKAWNAYREGRDVGYLMWRRGGASPEPFPEPA